MPHTVSLTTNEFRLQLDDSGVATVWIDAPDASVNKISRDTLDGFSEVLGHLEQMNDLTGVLFISGKDASFVVGADLNMLAQAASPTDVRSISRRAHRLLWRIDTLGVPTVAAIEGPCMGGGLELTLGCTYRLASTHDATKLALPEVKLGLLPGGGGTQYLPRRIGVRVALTMIMTGKNIYPRKARDLGLVDALIHPPGLYGAGKRAVRQLANGTLSAPSKTSSLTNRLLEDNPLSRRIIYRQARRRAEDRTHRHYPAPPRIIDAVRTGLERDLDAGLDAEMQHFGELAFTPESQALVEIFFSKRVRETHAHAEDAQPVSTVGILGAGNMGGGIAQVTAAQDLDVVLKDQSFRQAAQGKKQVWSAFNRDLEKGILNRFERDRATERVAPTDTYAQMDHCDLIIEAVPEDLSLKRTVLSDIADVVADDAILASNTSSIPIAQIAEAVPHPERVLGMHYFSPVADVPLVEIIVTDQTSEAALATALDLVETQNKTAIVVEDGPGFYTTRILSIYLNEALLLLEEGADVPTVDQIMSDYGFPMGPFELLDFVGIDVASKITDVMSDHFPLAPEDISDSAARLADAGLLGQKTNIGFYHYGPSDNGSGKDRKDLNQNIYRNLGQTRRATPSPAIVQERLTLMMVNEAVRCLDDGVLRGPRDGDVGAVFGLGFPAYLGGPFRFIDQKGPSEVTKRMRDLAYQFGDRFSPTKLLIEHDHRKTAFHDYWSVHG
ncbi:MAG: crotonase [Bacteroidetes bacterium SW_9_63_38]|nr:MAG: crotonase [Bacteroidetes bacterium SW_9_63_38]